MTGIFTGSFDPFTIGHDDIVRRHLAASPIFKGIPDFRQTRIAMLRANTADELRAILEEIRQRLTTPLQDTDND
nr:unnamed protein product [uncultured bacterium]